MVGNRRVGAALAVAALLAAGCSREVPPDPVSASDLQAGLADKLAQSGTPAKSVTCNMALPSQVGATARCDVTFNASDSVTALLTTTKVDGGKATWEITGPQLTKDQVEARVTAATGAKKVDCDSGMNGRVGNWVPCHVTKDGVNLNNTAEIAGVKGLAVKLAVTDYLPQQVVEDRVKAKLTPLYGRPPDTVACTGDLAGKQGGSLACMTTIDGNVDEWAVTVTSVTNGTIDFIVERPSQRRATGGDMCPGCPG